MIRVTIELVPGGEEKRARTIGQLLISRLDAVANPCDYDAHLVTFAKATGERTGVSTVVRAHRYEDGVWELIRRTLEVFLLPEADDTVRQDHSPSSPGSRVG